MIKLFNVPQYNIDTSKLGHLLHGNIVKEFEEEFADYVGAKYACSTSSCAVGIFLSMKTPWSHNYYEQPIGIPSILPYVVPNVLIHAGRSIKFTDNIDWVGHSYILHEFEDFKIIDSAQDVYYKQFQKEASPQDIILYSFYPTKPVGGCDGGMIVSDDEEKIEWYRRATMYGSVHCEDSWDRVLEFPGWKAYMNSIQAYIALQNLRKLDEKRQRLNEISSFYNHELGYNNNSCHLYRIYIEQNNREYMKAMKENGISTGIYYECCHLMEPYGCTNQKLPKSEYVGSHIISLPFHEELTQQELEQVVEKVNEFGYIREKDVTATQ